MTIKQSLHEACLCLPATGSQSPQSSREWKEIISLDNRARQLGTSGLLYIEQQGTIVGTKIHY